VQHIDRCIDGGFGSSSCFVPGAQQLEISEGVAPSEPSPGRSGGAKKIVVVPHEPDDAGTDEALQQVGPDPRVSLGSYHLPNVVQQRRGAQAGILCGDAGKTPSLQKVIEKIALGVPTAPLRDPIGGGQQGEELVVHGASTLGRLHTHLGARLEEACRAWSMVARACTCRRTNEDVGFP
jgi:hypothetical protein